MLPRLRVLTLFGMLVCASLALAQSTEKDSGFPFSVWLNQKEVTQIPWKHWIDKVSFRSDLRRVLRLSETITEQDLEKSGVSHDLVLFARVLEGGKVVTPVHSVTLAESQLQPETMPGVLRKQGSNFFNTLAMVALVSPGKYKLELALLDRTTGRYSTRFEDLSIDGDATRPLEQALRGSSKFEFIPTFRPDQKEQSGMDLDTFLAGVPPMQVLMRGGFSQGPTLTPRDVGDSGEAPAFVVKGKGTTHLSVVAVLSPPERAQGDARYYANQFHQNLTRLLGVFTRLDVARGTAQLTGLDLTNRTRVFDRVDMKGISADLLGKTIIKETDTVQLEDLAGKSMNGRFVRDVLQERFQHAENDTTGANHVIIVVGARQAFQNASGVNLPSPTRDCHCRVFYVRFALLPTERDDVERLLRPYRPTVYEPLSWQEFRDDFGKIYEQLLR